ncbi:MAG: hypothetical protein Fur003_3940 [Candidatus Dojkabacteria bacterium]
MALDKIKNTPLPYAHKKELLDKVQTEDIQQVSELVGDIIIPYKAGQIQKGYILPSKSSKYTVFINYRNVLEFGQSYSRMTSLAPSTELIIHINKILMRRIHEEWEIGKIRGFSEQPNEIYDTWYKLREFYPNLNPTNYFDELLNWVDDSKYATHRMIRFAILLYEFIDKAPLYSGNQLTTLSLITILAKEYGYNPEMLISYSKALNFIADDLISAFKLAKSKRDPTVFIEAFLYAISLETLNTQNLVSSTFNKKVKKQGKLRSKFNTRQIKVLEYLENVTKISREEYTQMNRVSFMTSYRDLQHLVKEGYLEVNGTGRGTYYTLIRKQETDIKKPKLEVFSDPTV